MHAWTLRPATADDRAFLHRVYAGTRVEELAPLGWIPRQQEDFLRLQFEAQDRYYRAQFPAAAYDVIAAGGTDVGRLYVDRCAAEIRVLDIALLPAYRGRGWGGEILRALIREGRESGRAVTLHVEVNNPARRLYRRLGFVDGDLHGVHLQMRHPGTAGGGARSLSAAPAARVACGSRAGASPAVVEVGGHS